MWKKIKYLIDNISEKDDEEKTLISRRGFLFTLPALVAIPKLIEPATLNVQPPIAFSGCAADFIAPSFIEVNRYQAEILRMLKKDYVFGKQIKKDYVFGKQIHRGRQEYLRRCGRR